MILSGLVVSTLLWANPLNPYVWIVLAVTLGFGFVGFYDDYLKVKSRRHSGFAGKLRLLIEAVDRAGGLLRAGAARPRRRSRRRWRFPFFKDVVINFGWFFVLFGAFVIVGAGNAVNLTDGLDGLAIVPVMIAAASFGMISYLTGNAVFSDYLQINYVAGTGELAVLCGAVLGAGLRIPLVQRAAGLDLHGRHRLARARRHARRDRGGGQARDRAGRDRRPVRAGSRLGDRAGGLVQADRQARVPDGAAASSFRAEGLDRAADRDPVLDHLGDAGARRPLHAEAAVSRAR